LRNLKIENMETDDLKKIKGYLFEIVTYMRISILIGIISVGYLIYTINTSKAYLGESVSNAPYNSEDTIVPMINPDDVPMINPDEEQAEREGWLYE
jgi:hypothetical protein